MALSVGQEGLKTVPWFSLTEWSQVYEQIYSNDVNEQVKGYEMLLTWKARVPKLPVGVDCTLSILRVCIRDREWAPKIHNGELPINYEDDLCLIYSTLIMRFLNHISNIGHTKQTSLYQIAKQINIPEWIVNLRHDIAHGYNLPSISLLRMAANILLAWLHEEYWAAEIKRMETCLIAEESTKEVQETKVQDFGDLIELWTSVSLYIHAGYHLVSKIPDPQLKETLQDLRSYAVSLLNKDNQFEESDSEDNLMEAASDDIKKDKKYTLETARIVLLSEISRYLSRKSIPNKRNIVCNTLLNSDAFLPNKDTLSMFSQNESEINVLPVDFIQFWKDIICLLYEKDLMEALVIKLVQLIDNEQISSEKKLLASLWINAIAYSFLKLDTAHCISRVLEYKLKTTSKKLSPEALQLKVKKETDRTYPQFKCVPWLNLYYTVLPCLTDIKFVSKLILNVNEFSAKFIVPILELISPKIDKEKKQLLLDLMNIYMMKGTSNENSKCEQTFTLEDLQRCKLNINNEEKKCEDRISSFLADKTIRNDCWKLAKKTDNWAECPIGLVPWQSDTMKVIDPLNTTVISTEDSMLETEIRPGIVDKKSLKTKSRINWDNVLRKKKRLNKRQERRNADIIMNKALETFKKKK